MSRNLVNGDSLKKYHIGFIEKHITPLINKTDELSDLNEEYAKKIDKLRNKNQESKKYIETLLDKVSKFTDGDMSLNKTGYIKLPTAFGGLKLQWMELVSTMKSGTSRLTHSEFCPIAHSSFLHCICSINKTSNGGYTEYHATVTPGDNLKSFTVEAKRDTTCTSDVTVKTTVFMIGV